MKDKYDEKIKFQILNTEKLQLHSMLRKYGLRKLIFIVAAESEEGIEGYEKVFGVKKNEKRNEVKRI